MLKDYPYQVFNKTPYTCFEGICGSRLYLAHTFDEWGALFDVLMSRPRISSDIESTGFKWFINDRICGMSFGWGVENFYIPVRHKDSETGGVQPSQLDMDVIRPDIQRLFNRKDLILIGHNFAKFDRHFFKADNIDINCGIHDTLLLWKLLDENAPGALKDVCSGWRDLMGFWHKGIVHPDANKDEKALSEWRGQEAKARKAVFQQDLLQQLTIRQSEIRFQGWKKNDLKKWVIQNDMTNHKYYRRHSKEDITYDYVPIVDMTKYAALDTFLAYKLYEYCLPKIQENKKLTNIYKNELKLSKVLWKAERKGVYIDKPYLEKVEKDFDKELSEKEKLIQERLGKITVLLKKATKTKPEEWGEVDVNITSNDQLAQALINNLGIELTDKTDSGKWAMDAAVMQKLAQEYEICKEILEYRKLMKLQNTYVRNIINSVVEVEGGGHILHSHYNQNVKSGRMSSSASGGKGTGLNLQNIPGKDDTIRKAFIPPVLYFDKELNKYFLNPDYYMFCGDYNQVELRLNAHHSQDPVLLEAYRNNQDVHLRTACKVFDIDYEEGLLAKDDFNHPRYKEVNELRKVAKVVNFASVYQVGPHGLSLQIPRPSKHKALNKEQWIEICKDFLEKYFEAHRAVKKFIIRGNRFIRENGYVENDFGRIRHLPEYNASKKLKDPDKAWMEAAAQRQGVNFMIQSSAGDIFKHSCVRADHILEGSNSLSVQYVHDDAWFYIHKNDLHLLPEIKKAMEDWDYLVPLKVEFSWVKDNWSKKIPIDCSSLETIMRTINEHQGKV